MSVQSMDDNFKETKEDRGIRNHKPVDGVTENYEASVLGFEIYRRLSTKGRIF